MSPKHHSILILSSVIFIKRKSLLIGARMAMLDLFIIDIINHPEDVILWCLLDSEFMSFTEPQEPLESRGGLVDSDLTDIPQKLAMIGIQCNHSHLRIFRYLSY